MLVYFILVSTTIYTNLGNVVLYLSFRQVEFIIRTTLQYTGLNYICTQTHCEQSWMHNYTIVYLFWCKRDLLEGRTDICPDDQERESSMQTHMYFITLWGHIHAIA